GHSIRSLLLGRSAALAAGARSERREDFRRRSRSDAYYGQSGGGGAGDHQRLQFARQNSRRSVRRNRSTQGRWPEEIRTTGRGKREGGRGRRKGIAAVSKHRATGKPLRRGRRRRRKLRPRTERS